MIALDILVEAEGWDAVPDLGGLCRRAAAAAASVAGIADEPLAATVLLSDDEALRELNRAWRGKDAATNVLSWPAPAGRPVEEPRELGDVAIAWDTVAREADQEGKRPVDHLAHLVVHGLLHLLGHDHERPDEADTMERLEREALAGLGIADPYREPA